MTKLLRDTFEEWSGQARTPGGLADGALGRQSARRGRVAVLAAGLATAAVVLAVVVPGLVREERAAPAAVITFDGVTISERPSPAPTDVRADTTNHPPKTLIAAGRVALSAYARISYDDVSGDKILVRRTWSLYDPATGGYERTGWSWLDVAPGLRVAAVLEGELPSKRLGILDLETRRILSWIDLRHPVAGLAWSPDGTKVLATSYSANPDLSWKGEAHTSAYLPGARTGYYLIDVARGEALHHRLPALEEGPVAAGGPTNGNARQDLGWSLDGKLLWSPTDAVPGRIFHTLDGRPHAAPAEQAHADLSNWSSGPGGLGGSTGGRALPWPVDVGQTSALIGSTVVDPATGEVLGRLGAVRPLAWADGDHVVATGCADPCAEGFANGLILVSVGGGQSTQLSLGDSAKGQQGRLDWLLTPR